MIKPETNEYAGHLAIRQIRDLMGELTGLSMSDSLSEPGFSGIRLPGCASPGILWTEGRLKNPGLIALHFGLVCMKDEKVNSAKLVGHLQRAGILEQTSQGEITTTIKVAAEPLGPIREEQIRSKISALNDLAVFLQKETSPGEIAGFEVLREKYIAVKEFLDPIIPLDKGLVIQAGKFEDKVSEAILLLKSGLSVALIAESGIITRLFFRSAAHHLMMSGESIGQFSGTSLILKGIPDMVSKAPGIVCIASLALLTGSPYERGDEVDTLLGMLYGTGQGVLFFGSRNQLQSVFGSGQGKKGNPVLPVIIHIGTADIGIAPLVDFAISTHGANLSIHEKEKTRNELVNFYDSTSSAHDIDLLEPYLRNLNNGGNPDFLMNLKQKKETFRGLPVINRFRRDFDLQQNLISSLESGTLREYLGGGILGQEEALDEVTARIWSDLLSRKPHQPLLQLLLQGIAEFLEIPHISIDTASFSSQHEASSMILGSGRGIVQSYLPGKLEIAANNPNGSLIEIADLDHCHPSTRSFFADLFLHILENGYAQSANGELISCTNLLLVFTINLPGGRDEMALRSLGFNNKPDIHTIKKNVRKEIKNIFSAAFLSRIGDPILFFPIREDVMPALLEMAIKKSLSACFTNLGIFHPAIQVLPGTTETMLKASVTLEASSGARAVYELARNSVTGAIKPMIGQLRTPGYGLVEVSVNPDNTLDIHLK